VHSALGVVRAIRAQGPPTSSNVGRSVMAMRDAA